MSRNYLLLFFSIFMFFSCSSDDEPTITKKGALQVRATLVYDGQALVFEETVDTVRGNQIRISKFGTYVSDFMLTSSEGSVETDLFEVDLIDFSNQNRTLSGAMEGLDVGTYDVPAGIYSGIKASLGVNDELNVQKPNDFAAEHPLGDQGRYWVAWESYIFSFFEGRYDNEMNGSFDDSFVWHTGGSNTLQTLTFDKSIEIREGETSIVEIEFDLKSLLSAENAPNYTTESQLHTQEKKEVMLAHFDQLTKTIVIK